MSSNLKLPFVGRIFWKVLTVVVILVVGGWVLIPKFSEYEIESQDYGGSCISGIIFAYLVHLWLLPAEEAPPDEEPPQ